MYLYDFIPNEKECNLSLYGGYFFNFYSKIHESDNISFSIKYIEISDDYENHFNVYEPQGPADFGLEQATSLVEHYFCVLISSRGDYLIKESDYLYRLLSNDPLKYFDSSNFVIKNMSDLIENSDLFDFFLKRN